MVAKTFVRERDINMDGLNECLWPLLLPSLPPKGRVEMQTPSSCFDSYHSIVKTERKTEVEDAEYWTLLE